jgi:hypothetical protein
MDPDASKAEFVSWRFSLADFEGPWTWKKLSGAKLDEVHGKLCN